MPGVVMKNLPRKSGPSTPTLYGGVAQADRDAGTRHHGLNSWERDGYRVCCGNRQLKLEREISAKAVAWPMATRARLLGVSASGFYT
jgi:transposase